MTPPVIPVIDEGGGKVADLPATAKSLVSQAVANVPPAGGDAAVVDPPAVVVPPVEPVVPPVTPPAVDPPVVVVDPPPIDLAAAAAATDPPVTDPPTEPVITADDVADIAAEVGVPFQEAVDRLEALGIGVEHDNIPEDFHDRYGALLARITDAVEPVFAEQNKARDALDAVERFKTRMAENPKSALLALWAAKPDAFAEVATIAQAAADDPEYKTRVIREIDVEAREVNVDVRENQFTEQQLYEKGRRAAAITQTVAAQFGVDQKVAADYVASAVGSVGADVFDLNNIPVIIKQLRPMAPKAPAAPKTITPAQVVATAEAPKAPVVTDSPPVPGATSGLTSDTLQKGRGGAFAKLIRSAGERVDALRGG